jgi:quinol monooxygenase YgiN
VIQAVLEIKVSQSRLDELIRAFKSLMTSAQAECGLIACKLYHQVGNETLLCYVEDWQTTEDLERQIRSNRYTQLLALMETAIEMPSMEFRTVSQTQGLEYLQAVRSSAGATGTKNKSIAEN